MRRQEPAFFMSIGMGRAAGGMLVPDAWFMRSVSAGLRAAAWFIPGMWEWSMPGILCSGCAYIMVLDASAASRQTRFRLIQFS
jgi:hypothetical protein